MPTELGSLLRATRISLGLKLGQLAKLLGYRSLNGGARRLERLELSGQEKAEFVDRVVAVLGIDEAIISDARVRDEASRREEFEAWLTVPVPMQLLTMIAGCTIQLPLPEGLDDAQAIAYATDLQRQQRIRLCLVLSRRRSLWFSANGESLFSETTMDSPNVPYTTVG